ncbi:hypothetical protein MMC18_008512 [Xylographa bjoerkii]|nr:hypothetical protein [Xylographa bjoerkii]
MAKPSLVGVKKSQAKEYLQPDTVSVYGHDTDTAGSDHDQQSLNLGDSPSEQLLRENHYNASILKKSPTAVATGAHRVLQTHELAVDELLHAERSAMIFNSALQEQSRNTFGELAPAIIFEPATPVTKKTSVTKKRMLGSDAIQSPSKRLRGRPTTAVVVEEPNGPLSPTIPGSGRLKRPTYIPTQYGVKVAKARAAEDIYDLPENSPLKPKRSSLPIQKNYDAAQESREDTTGNSERSTVVKATTEAKEAKEAAPELPRKRGRPPKSSTKPSLRNEASIQNQKLPTDDHVAQSGSSLQILDNPDKPANAMVKQNDLTKKLTGMVHEKEKPITEGLSCTRDGTSTGLVAGHVSQESAMTPASTSRDWKGMDARDGDEAVESRTEDHEEEYSDYDPDFVDEHADEINDNHRVSARVDLEEDVNNITDEAEQLNERDPQTIAARLDREAGRALVALEIFGANERWEQALQAARSVGSKKGGSVSGQRRVGHNIPLMTKTITKFLEKVKKAGLCYQQAKSVEDTSTESKHNLRSRLRDHTLWLKSAIENIHETKDATKNVQLVQDIYVYAIPKLVFLLENALDAQSTLYSADEETESLKNIIGVQGLVVELCQKVEYWCESAMEKGNSLPKSDLPIKGATSRKILPYLRDIGEIIQNELDSIQEETRRARDESARLEMYHAREARWQEKRKKNQAERKQKQQQAAKDALRLSGQSVTYTSRPYRQTPTEAHQWTEDQDRELLRLLWELGDLPAERRYLIILNTPLLQNKLPEHIKRRALMLKPAMESNFLQNGLGIPQWIPCHVHIFSLAIYLPETALATVEATRGTLLNSAEVHGSIKPLRRMRRCCAHYSTNYAYQDVTNRAGVPPHFTAVNVPGQCGTVVVWMRDVKPHWKGDSFIVRAALSKTQEGIVGAMASTDIETPSGTPPAEERLPEILSGGESPTMTTRNTSSREGHKPIVSSPRRNGIPPKRPTATIKRGEASASTSNTKTTPSSRSTPGSSLSKPPSRLITTSSARRPVPGVITSTASSSVHKSRPSTSSVEESRKMPAAEGTENKRPIVAGAAKRVSLAPSVLTKSTSHKAPTSADPRSTLNSTIPNDKDISSSRSSVTSPTRVIAKSATTPLRPGVSSSITRSGRAPPSSARGVHGASAVEASKKRLSTIPASPAPPPASESTDTVGSPPVQGLKPVRPSLGPRKSTMSVTIEQRLQEMELVNEMLKIAMAEDGEESDEVKEEYGRKVDETLADLREQLEEARRKEGKPPLSSADGTPPTNEKPVPIESGHSDATPDILPNKQIEELQSALTASQEKVATLEADLEYIQTKMNQYSEEVAQVSRDGELATKNIRLEHVSKIEELSAFHAAENEALRNQLVEAESKHTQYVERSLQDIEEAKAASIKRGSQEATRLLEGQQRAHEDALKVLQDRLNSEKNNGSDTASRVSLLQSELSMLKSQFEKERQRTTKQMEDAQTQFENILKEKDELIEIKEADILTVQRELEQLEITHNRELEEAEATSSQHLLQIQRTENEARQQMRKLEAELTTTTDELQGIQRTTANKISSMDQVIESLQDELQILRERKDREIDALKVRLIQEHDETMTKTQAEHELALQAAKEDANQRSLNMVSRHNDELQDLRRSLEKTKQEHNEALSTLLASNSELQEALVTIRAENSSITEAKLLLEKALKDASAEISGLKKVLETFDKDSQGKEEQNASIISKMKEDLERTAQTLQEKSSESSALLENHSIELETIRKNHADELETIKAESVEKADGALSDLQEKYDLLQRDLQKAQDNSEESMNSVKSAHTEMLRRLTESHNDELVELKDRHTSHLKQVMSAAETAAEKLENAEEKHRKAIDDLSRQQDEDLEATKEGHQKVFLDLQGQVLQHRKDLANAENELQSSRELQNSTERETRDKHVKELEELRSQIAVAQADAAQSRMALESLQGKNAHIEATIKQQSTELDDLHNTLAEDKETIVRLTAAAMEADKVLSDAAGATELREELTRLRQSHDSEMTKLQETMSIEAEKREKERKQGAEVRDRLVGQLAELENFRTEFPAAKELAQEHMRAAEVARNEAKDAHNKLNRALTATKEHEMYQAEVSAKLDKALATSKEYEMRQQDLSAELEKALIVAKEHEGNHQKALTELEKVRAELTKAKNRRLSQSAVGSEIMQELDALQIIADKERDKNDRLKKQIAEISATAEAHATRVREMEAALKVTTAELTEMKTKRADGKEFATTPVSKKGLRTSRWAADSNDDGFVEVAGDPEGEELGSSIEGTMAGIQEQIRQLEGVNEDMIGESERLVTMLSKATGSRTSLSIGSPKP